MSDSDRLPVLVQPFVSGEVTEVSGGLLVRRILSVEVDNRLLLSTYLPVQASLHVRVSFSHCQILAGLVLQVHCSAQRLVRQECTEVA